MKACIDSMIGEDTLAFELNGHALPSELEVPTEGSTQYLELEWAPVADELDEVKSVLLTIRDVTEVRKLREEAEKTAKSLLLLKEITTLGSEKFIKNIRFSQSVYDFCLACVTSGYDNFTAQMNRIKRDLHTVKADLEELKKANLFQPIADAIQVYKSTATDKLNYNLSNESEVTLSFGETQLRNLQSILKSSDSSEPSRLLKELFWSKFGPQKLSDMLQTELKSVEKTAKSLEKLPPQLSLEGEELAEFDRELGPCLAEAFTHILTNCVDHGLEKPSSLSKQPK